MKKSLCFIVSLLLIFMSCKEKTNPNHSVTASSIREKLQGSWNSVGDDAYCELYFTGDSVIWVDASPERTDRYELRGDTLCMAYLGDMMQNIVSFVGDTLVLTDVSDPTISIKYLPFGTIAIGGKRVMLPNKVNDKSEKEWKSVISDLSHQPLDSAALNEWNKLYLFVDGAVADNVDYTLASLYKKNPGLFLHWIAAYTGANDNKIQLGVFGGWEETVGYPTKAAVKRDVSRMKNQAEKKLLNSKLNAVKIKCWA